VIQSHSFRWRARILSAKLQNKAPGLGWFDVARLMVPHRFRPWTSAKYLASSFYYRASDRQPWEKRCLVFWKTPSGHFWGREEDDVLLVGLYVEQWIERAYEREPVVVKTGDIVLDAGAHLGTFSRYALDRGARMVIAVEPEPTNCACFQRTFEKEIREGRVVLLREALWNQPGTLALLAPEKGNSGTGQVLHAGLPDGNYIKAFATTIDDIVGRLNLENLDFIKMDIEGAERYALLGASKTLSRFYPRMAITTEHSSGDTQLLPKLVLQAAPQYCVFSASTQLYFHKPENMC